MGPGSKGIHPEGADRTEEEGGVVLKIGGSLYGLPDLKNRIATFLFSLSARPLYLVPGGGPTADVIRRFDRIHRLGEEASHWLALQALKLNAHFLNRLFPGWPLIQSPSAGAPIAIVDVEGFARNEEIGPTPLPHLWEVTSDTLALRFARRHGVRELILLKSTDFPENIEGWGPAAEAGLVDPYFPKEVSPDVSIRWINLRSLPTSPES